MPAPQIRALALCVFRNGDRILVTEAHDPVRGRSFCRPLGGGIEFGETGVQAVVREIREEIGAEIADVRYLGTLENIFTYLGRPGHEIVQVYDARLIEASLYEGSSPAPKATVSRSSRHGARCPLSGRGCLSIQRG